MAAFTFTINGQNRHVDVAPVKLTDTREDDLHTDRFRPASYMKFRAGKRMRRMPFSLETFV